MRGYYASAGVRSGALPHVVAANMGHSSFAMTAQHYAQPQAIAEVHSARVLESLGLTPSGAKAPLSVSAEQLFAKLPPAMLTRLAELIAQQSSVLPTGLPDGG